MRKVFTVIINGKERDVWDIEGKEEDAGNGEPLTWWVYGGDRLPDGIEPPIDSEHWVHYHGSIERRLWDIRFKQLCTTKEKWGSTHFRSHTSVEMWCNNKLVYSFGTTGSPSGLSFAMAKVQYMQVLMQEHSFNFFEPEKENGRKICWYGLPATVKVKSNTWEIAVMPDYEAGLDKEQWWAEYANRRKKYTKPDGLDEQFEEMDDDDFEESKREDYINWGDAFSDEHIYWFRK